MRDNLVAATLSLILMGVIAFEVYRRLEDHKHRQKHKLQPPQSTVI